MSQDLPPLEGRYRLGAELGRGGFGAVFAAVDVETGRPAAVKRSTRSALPEDAERIRREVALLAGLRHPNLVELYGVYRAADGTLALVYELLEGETMAQRVAREPPGTREALGWVQGVAAGLDALHARGVLHRDVKPANIMIEPQGRARLLDYGLARPDRPGATVTETGVILGTPHFMAPEAIQGARPDRAGDLYSLAASTYWVLTGRVPFPGDSPVQILQAQQGDLPPTGLPGSEGAALDRTLARALGRHPDDRPGSGAQFAAALEAALRRQQVATTQMVPLPPRPAAAMAAAAQTPTPMRRARPAGRQVRRLALLAGLAVCIGLGFLLPRAPAPPAPPAPPPSPQSPPPHPGPSAAEVVQGLGAPLRSRLTDLQGILVDPSGKALPEATRTGRAVLDLTGGDPALWPRLLDRLPTLVGFLDWVGAGGHPEELPAETREDMARTDAYFHEQGLPRPFGPLLGVGPVSGDLAYPPGLARIVHASMPELPLPAKVTGWLATALRALERARSGGDAKHAWIRAHPDQAPPGFRSAYLAGGGVLAPTLRQVVSAAWDLVEARPTLATWLREEIEAMQTALYALGRALDAGETVGVTHALALDAILDQGIGTMLLSHLHAYPLPWLLGAAARDLARHPPANLVAARVFRFQRTAVRKLWGRAEDAAALESPRHDTLRAAMTVPRQGLGLRVIGIAANELVQDLAELGRYRDVLAVHRAAALRPEGGDQPGFEWLTIRTAAVVQRLGEPAGLTRAELTRLREDLAACSGGTEVISSITLLYAHEAALPRSEAAEARRPVAKNLAEVLRTLEQLAARAEPAPGG